MISTGPHISSRWTRIFHRALLAGGAIAIALLLWKLDTRTVLRIVGRVSWGILFIFALELVSQTLNAFAWRLSFTPREAQSYRLTELWRLWLSMDGINYLIPTGTVAGEVARASMLNDSHPAEIRSASVVASRIGETVAQVVVVLAGLLFFGSSVPRIRSYAWMFSTAAVLLAAMSVAALAYLLFGRRWIAPTEEAQPAAGLLKATSRHLRAYFAHCRWRFATAVIVFAAAYIWRAFEAFWICRFIGTPVTVKTALTIEVLSIAIDGALFVVPAKIGIQELGKTAIFSLLGLPLASGLAFGIVRHVREIFWAVIGFTIYSVSKRLRRSALPDAVF